MPVFKNKTQGQYVNVYKDILKNHSLSLRDRGNGGYTAFPAG